MKRSTSGLGLTSLNVARIYLRFMTNIIVDVSCKILSRQTILKTLCRLNKVSSYHNFILVFYHSIMVKRI